MRAKRSTGNERSTPSSPRQRGIAFIVQADLNPGAGASRIYGHGSAIERCLFQETSMKRAIFFAVVALTMATSNAFAAGEPVMVGGQAMYPSKDIVDNAVNSADHTTLVAAVKAAGLVDTLKSAGPFTVFAPTNEAFAALPPGTVETLVKPENKAALTSILTYHVVPGRYDFRKLDTAIKAGGGKTELKTINGEMLTFSENGPHNIVVADAFGHTAEISTYDVVQSNGVIMVVDKVLMPK
jgi:uncharacterized surface protein with fasciclin (FAS1) repeats